ncbi:MAG TPA: phosphatase PAP2 family protein [Pseudoneobacillus sp.]|nr:phosphatase PAP2 family protein [Pseudoneobacillus sp.]
MDRILFRSINQLAGRYNIIDSVMIFASKRLRYIYLLILIFLCINNSSSREVAKNAIKSACITWLLHFLSKTFYFKPRPFLFHRVGILIPSKMDSSYLSKHTILAFAVSTSIYLKQYTLGKLMTKLSILTGFSRIWVGHHYPSDIIRSAFLGATISYFVDKFSLYKSDHLS